jgi:hypothetical protein
MLPEQFTSHNGGVCGDSSQYMMLLLSLIRCFGLSPLHAGLKEEKIFLEQPESRRIPRNSNSYPLMGDHINVIV